LLEYLAPRDGRPAPLDLKANDVAHWQTTMVAERVEDVPSLARLRLFSLVTPTPVQAPSSRSRGALVRDPDGHGVRILT
uniref:hypothetical protein n=1 Tax=Salmonella sp. SAL4431 TaxID=3159886 RepID=UPI00397831EC